jgi:AraC family transcriptional regulator
MLTYSLATNAARRPGLVPPPSADPNEPCSLQSATLLRIDRRPQHGDRSNGRGWQLHDSTVVNGNSYSMEIAPTETVTRRTAAWDGMTAEILQVATHDEVEFRFRAPWHLLLVYEEGVREEGETVVGDLPVSTLRTLRRKLTFVPAGQAYQEWHRPRIRSRILCFYFDPSTMPVPSVRGGPRLAARLFFENAVLWETAVKLAAAIEDGSENERYREALGVVLAHELVHTCANLARRGPLARGGLAAWQQRRVATYVEEHLAEAISLGALAKLVNLSSYYFCRAFKQSFGVPPHRYHINRRIEAAKAMLRDPAPSVTEIALALGFSETSSFSAAFRQATGNAPTEYRRALAQARSL